MARRCHFPPRIVWVPWFKRHGYRLAPGSRALTRSKGIGFQPTWLRKAHYPIQCGSVRSGWRSPSLCFVTATRLPHFCRCSSGSLIVGGRPPVAKNREYRQVEVYNSPGEQQPPQENAQATTNSLLGKEGHSYRQGIESEQIDCGIANSHSPPWARLGLEAVYSGLNKLVRSGSRTQITLKRDLLPRCSTQSRSPARTCLVIPDSKAPLSLSLLATASCVNG
jgi:hypothetical protein